MTVSYLWGKGFMLLSNRRELRERIASAHRLHLCTVGISTLSGLLMASAVGSQCAWASTPEFSSVSTNREATGYRERVQVDTTVLDTAVSNAENMGVQVRKEGVISEIVENRAVPERQDAIRKSYREQASTLEAASRRLQELNAAHSISQSEAEAKYQREMADYERDKAAYDRAKEQYDREKAQYDAHLEEQITAADPNHALSPGKLVYEQPFTISENRNSLVRVEGVESHPGQNNLFDAHNNYNSDSVTHVYPTDGSSFTVLYKNVARDKATGRSLDARIHVSDVVTSTTNPGRPTIEVFSNYSDNVALYNVTAVKQTVSFAFSDTGEEYARNYYVSFGSLNGQHQGDKARYEYANGVYAAAGRGVIATFVNPKSEISREAQPVHGSASKAVTNAFMLPQGGRQSRSIADTDPDIMTHLGVTFLAHNSSSFWVGTSGGSPGHDPDDVERITATYNHVMLSSDTVAPTEAMPTPPQPPALPKRQEVPPVAPVTASVRYYELFTPSSGTEKVAQGEGKFVLPGQTTHQTVTKSTGFEPLKQFVIGDNIFATEDGRVPVAVDMASVRVESGGVDVSDRFHLVKEETEFQGKKVLQVRAEAKDAQTLTKNTAYTLRLSQTALADGSADDEFDAGFSIVNGRLDYTETHAYHEPSIDPHKRGASSVSGEDINQKAVTVGETIQYLLSLDASQLADTVEPITRFGMIDDYDETHGRIDVSSIRIYKVPSETDGANLKALREVVTTGSEDVTDQFELKDSGAAGLSIMAKVEGGRLIPPLGCKYVISIPYTVTINADGDISNTAWQIVNDHRLHTETVANHVRKINPHKDIVMSSTDRTSLDGHTIPLGQMFDYRLDSSIRPAQYGGQTTEWTIFDDYDESHDRYDGNFVVLSTSSFVRENGSVIGPGEDITRYFTQKIDQRSGAVTYSATDEFLKILNLESNRAKEQAWSVYVQMTRIDAGDVENTFTESYNGNWLKSNPVRTHTPTPSQPSEEPPRPQGPPAQPVPPQPESRDPEPPGGGTPWSQEAPPEKPADELPGPPPRSPEPLGPSPEEPRRAGPIAHTGVTGDNEVSSASAVGIGIGTVLVGYGAYRGRHRRKDPSHPADRGPRASRLVPATDDHWRPKACTFSAMTTGQHHNAGVF